MRVERLVREIGNVGVPVETNWPYFFGFIVFEISFVSKLKINIMNV